MASGFTLFHNISNYTYESEKDAEDKIWYERWYEWSKSTFLKNGPGLLLLLFLSAFFSTINFYSGMTRADSSWQISYRYLLAWILVNYSLAMILLFLIIPENVYLREINRTMFLYCLIATAFPELAANIKLQMGDGKAALDLMKYKTKVAQYIDNQIGRGIERDKNYYLRFLESFYENKPQEFETRFTNFMNSNISDPVEIQTYTELLKAAPISPGDILSEVQKKPDLTQKLLSFFGDIVENIKSFPEWELITAFNYRLSPENAKALVTSNITTVGKFMKSRNKDPDFIKLSEKTHIKSTELNAAYYIVKKAWSLWFKRTLKWGFAGMAILTLLIYLITKQESHYQNSVAMPADEYLSDSSEEPVNDLEEFPSDESLNLDETSGNSE